MQDLYNRLKALSAAEEFFDFFGVPFDPQVMQVNRLHILQRFRQYLQCADGLDEQDTLTLFCRFRECLAHAYRDFVFSDARREKVFKVLQQADGTRTVSLSTLHDKLAPRRTGRPRRTAAQRLPQPLRPTG